MPDAIPDTQLAVLELYNHNDTVYEASQSALWPVLSCLNTVHNNVFEHSFYQL